MAAPGMTTPGVLDQRVLGRPIAFSGEEKDWREWSFVFVAFLSTLSPEFRDEMHHAGVEADEIDPSRLNASVRARSEQLYYLLCVQCRGKALELLRAVPATNGYEGWRRLVREYV